MSVEEITAQLPVVISASLATLAVGVGVSSLCLPILKQALLPSPKEAFLSDLLPFDRLEEDGATILCKDGLLVKVIHLRGLDYGAKTKEEKIILLNNRQAWLDVMAKDDLEFTVITQRQLASFTENKSSSLANPILGEIQTRWNTQFQKTYRTQYFIVMTEKPRKKSQKSTKNWQDQVDSVLDYLSPYQPEILTSAVDREDKKGRTGSLLSFWSQMINGFEHSLDGVKDNLSERMTSSTVHFHTSTGIIEQIDGENRKYNAVLSIKQWHDSLSDTVFAELSNLPCEFRLVHWLAGKNKVVARSILSYAQKQAAVLFYTHHTKEQYDTAIEWVDSSQSTLYEAQVSLILSADTKEHLQKMIQEVRRIFRMQNLKPAVETQAAEWLWLSQFPGFLKRVRVNKLFSQNVANLLSFSKDQQGVESCDWGQGPLRMFKTSTGSAYSLQLHLSERREELAHSLVVAPSGSGKTTFFQHLIGGALRHDNLRAYIFDRLSGTRIFTESIGGKFIDLGEKGSLSLNPLQCDDTPINRAFLSRFLMQLGSVEDDESLLAVNRAVDAIFELPMKARILSSIYESAIDVGSPLKASLRKWVGSTQQARWFNGQTDSLDINQNRLVTFEMASLQQDPVAYAAMVTYVMHRIRDQMKDKALPHMIFIDESAPMLEDPLFRGHVKELFREHRKLRGSISVCFQDASAIETSGIKDTILNQCQTVFLFPNPNADRQAYEMFNITDDQWAFIKGTTKNTPRRAVLVKRIAPENNEAVILDIDLSPLGPYLKLYRSGSDSVQLVKQLQAQFGLENWTDRYLEVSV